MARITRSLIQEATNTLSGKKYAVTEDLADMSAADRGWYKQVLKNTQKYFDKALDALASAESELEDYEDIDSLDSTEKKICKTALKELQDIQKKLDDTARKLGTDF